MKFLVCFFVCVLLAVVFYAVITFIRFAFVHIKAYVLRRKLSSLKETEIKKDD